MKELLKQVNRDCEKGIGNFLPELIATAAEDPGKDLYCQVIEEFTAFFSNHLSGEHFPAFVRINIPDQDSERPRVVILGDLHSDFNALSAILKKLANSKYDYFKKALFILLGDYTDRGSRPVETLRLLFALKSCLGNRCILMRGNHELLVFADGRLHPLVYPSGTPEMFNGCLTPGVNRMYADFCARLPYGISLTHSGRRYLICHGGIPKYDYFSHYDEEKLVELILPVQENTEVGKMLGHMLWGDPVDHYPGLQRFEVRFEYGRAQFDEFMKDNGYDMLIRGHEPVDHGSRLSFENRLLTLFSSGGRYNTDSFYQEDVSEPAFAVIGDDGRLTVEKVPV